METGYRQLRQKEVVNVQDGKKLGRVNDVVFTFPQGKTLGIVVPNGKGLFQPDLFVDLRNIVKIGEDVVLVDLTCPPKPPARQEKKECCGEHASPCSPCRNFEEEE